MTREEFNKLWKDSTKEQILNQYYYDYEEMIKSHNTIKEARKYFKKHTLKYDDLMLIKPSDVLEILDKVGEE